MKRFAAHYLFFSPEEYYKLHYIELDADNIIQKIAPLESEIANTSFYNGIIFVCPQSPEKDFIHAFSKAPVALYHSESIDLLSSEFRAGDGSSDRDVQRLC